MKHVPPCNAFHPGPPRPLRLIDWLWVLLLFVIAVFGPGMAIASTILGMLY